MKEIYVVILDVCIAAVVVGIVVVAGAVGIAILILIIVVYYHVSSAVFKFLQNIITIFYYGVLFRISLIG